MAQIAPKNGNGTDDLFLGFQALSGAGASSNLVVDLGAAPSFSLSSFSTIITALSPGLTGLYGSNWATRTDLTWGLIGAAYPAVSGGDAANTLYASTLTGSPAWNRASASAQGTQRANVFILGGQYQTDYNNAQWSTGGSAGGTGGIVMASTEAGSWASQTTYLGNSFGGFNGGIQALVTQNLDLYKLAPGSGAGALVGTLSLTAVPEPSTNALIAVTSIALVGYMIRRRNVAKA